MSCHTERTACEPSQQLFLDVRSIDLNLLSLSQLVLSQIPCQSLETAGIVVVDELLLVLFSLEVLRVVCKKDTLEELVRVLHLTNLLEHVSTDVLKELKVGIALELLSKALSDGLTEAASRP